MRDSFILYADTYIAIKKLNDKDAGKLLHAIFKYQLEGVLPKLSPVVDIIFDFIKNHLDRDNSKWIDEKHKRSLSGHLGGLKSGVTRRKKMKQNEANEASASNASKNEANEAVNVSVSVNDNVSVNKRGAFAPPTIEEVSIYCQERDKGIKAISFIDYYSARGWMIGKNKMKDWKAAVRTWENRRAEDAQKGEVKNGYTVGIGKSEYERLAAGRE